MGVALGFDCRANALVVDQTKSGFDGAANSIVDVDICAQNALYRIEYALVGGIETKVNVHVFARPQTYSHWWTVEAKPLH